MPTPAPCVRMARIVASTSAARRSSRWRSQRESRPSRGARGRCRRTFGRRGPSLESNRYLLYRLLPVSVILDENDRSRSRQQERPMASQSTPRAPRRVAVLGGNRIPFARSNGPYAKASNQDMLTATVDGLVARYGLAGERLGEVVAGAVLKHSRDFNLTRETVLGTRLDPTTPAYDIQQACGTGLEAAILVANKIALGQVDAGIAGGVDSASDAPIAVSEGLRRTLLGRQPRPLRGRARQGARRTASRTPRPGHPRERRAAHRPVDGRAHGPDRGPVGHHPRGPGRARRRQPPAPRRRLRARLLRRPRHALPRRLTRHEPARRLHASRSCRRSSRSSARATARR